MVILQGYKTQTPLIYIIHVLKVASTVDEFVTAARQNEVTNAHLEVVRDFCLKAQDVTDYIASQVGE